MGTMVVPASYGSEDFYNQRIHVVPRHIGIMVARPATLSPAIYDCEIRHFTAPKARIRATKLHRVTAPSQAEAVFFQKFRPPWGPGSRPASRNYWRCFRTLIFVS